MKLRTLALAGAAALALSVPATASGTTGWYIGLGVGWDMMSDFNGSVTPPYGLTWQTRANPNTTDFKVNPDDSALFIASVGYRFDNRFRIENEIGYELDHSITVSSGGVKIAGVSGDAEARTDMLNIMYDLPLSDRLGSDVRWRCRRGEPRHHREVQRHEVL